MKIFKVIVICSVFFMILSVSAFSELLKESPLSDFISAGLDYKNGKCKEAVEQYEGLLGRGIESGALYYNLANSYFKLGEKGKAILNYERAKLIIPRDSDLAFNYKFAASGLSDYPGNVKNNSLFGFLLSYLEKYTFEELYLVLNVFVLLAVIGHLFFIFFKGLPRKYNNLILAIFLSVILIFSILLYFKVNEQKNLAVTIKNTEAHFEPKDDSTKHFDIPEGIRVRILNLSSDWCKIKRLDGKYGWVRADSIELIRIKE